MLRALFPSLATLLTLAAVCRGQVTITEYPVPNSGNPYGITTGPDGNLWFTDWTLELIGKITPSGVITEFPLPSDAQPWGITAGPDGNLWFTECGVTNPPSAIAKISTSGVITEYPLPTSDAEPLWITAGPDGNLWFTESHANKIGKISTSGVITEYPLPHAQSDPLAIAAGPDGRLWFTETAQRIGNITVDGIVTETAIDENASRGQAIGITAGPDGNMWFTNVWFNAETWYAAIGKITPQGTISEYPMPNGSGPQFITAGPDGNMWFTEQPEQGSGGSIWEITTAGVMTQHPISNPLSGPNGITVGPDRNIWFADLNGQAIGEVVLPSSPQERLGRIISEVSTLVTQGMLRSMDGTSLISKLQSAIRQLNNGNTHAATGQISAFINEVNAFVNSRRISVSQSQALIAATNSVLVGI